MANISSKILLVTRAKDWRLSFLPFIIGCVYLWLWRFEIKFSASSLLLFILSFFTTIGFASLGYFINEFFDKKQDAKAGKTNVLITLPAAYQAGLLIACLACALLPWMWLPFDKTTWVLIAAEIILLLLYSMPFPRLKNVPLVSGFIDAAYAYMLPLALSFHTYKLFASGAVSATIYFLLFAVFLIGFRNITIHQVNDIFKDKCSGASTLPQILGVKKTTLLMASLLLLEIVVVLLWSLWEARSKPLLLFWVFALCIFLFIRLKNISSFFNVKYFCIEPVRHLTDPAYQYVFPAVCLLLTAIIDYRWLALVPFHFAMLLTKPMQIIAWETIYWKSIQWKFAGIRTVTTIIIIPASWLVNYSIYFAFMAMGVNLRKEKKNAWCVIKEKLRIK